jgi:predicted DsbA family dithiol-disulfide isomerase
MISKLANMQAAIRHVNNMTEEIKVKMKEYDVKAVPTTIIDGKIKVVGVSDVPWICGDDLYKKIKREYPL